MRQLLPIRMHTMLLHHATMQVICLTDIKALRRRAENIRAWNSRHLRSVELNRRDTELDDLRGPQKRLGNEWSELLGLSQPHGG